MSLNSTIPGYHITSDGRKRAISPYAHVKSRFDQPLDKEPESRNIRSLSPEGVGINTFDLGMKPGPKFIKVRNYMSREEQGQPMGLVLPQYSKW